MPITTCTSCEKAFEAWSEEYANEPGRLCRECDTREAKDAALGLHEMVKDLEKDNALLRQRLTLTEAVVDAARKSVNNPKWAGICDEDIELERAIAELEGEK